jgi:4-hydroxybenzoate polyprenyltransferase
MNNIIKIFRIHHWVKNIIILVPFFAAHQVVTLNVLQVLFFGILSFSLCASAVYIINDLFDIKSDQKDPYKKYRAFAAGEISMQACILLSIFLIVISFFLAKRFVSLDFLLIVLIYFLLSFLYSAILKKFILIDCLILSILYTLRIFAGSAIIKISPSFWLIIFSIFFFLSLSFIKRFAEVSKKKHSTLRYGYYQSDKIFIGIIGVNAGYISVLISALYLNSENVIIFYKNQELLWIGVIILLFWINWIWLKVYRNLIDQDPVLFTLKDPVSIITVTVLLIVFLFAS